MVSVYFRIIIIIIIIRLLHCSLPLPLPPSSFTTIHRRRRRCRCRWLLFRNSFSQSSCHCFFTLVHLSCCLLCRWLRLPLRIYYSRMNRVVGVVRRRPMEIDSHVIFFLHRELLARAHTAQVLCCVMLWLWWWEKRATKTHRPRVAAEAAAAALVVVSLKYNRPLPVCARCLCIEYENSFFSISNSIRCVWCVPRIQWLHVDRRRLRRLSFSTSTVDAFVFMCVCVCESVSGGWVSFA